jgi:hypothetical protein
MATTNETASSTTDSEMSNFKLRIALLKIWVLKNASLIMKIALIVVLTALVLCITLIPQFRDWLIDVRGDDGAITWEKIVGYVTGALSALSTAWLVVYKVKKITLDDIKGSSRSVKEAMVKYGYYFNKDGKLCKRKVAATVSDDATAEETDKAVGIDNVSASGGIVTGTIRAAQELNTIMKASTENGDTVESVSKDADLDASDDSAASDLEGSLLSDEAKAKIDEKVDSISDSAAEIVGASVENADADNKLGLTADDKADAGKAAKSAVKSLFKDTWADIKYGFSKLFGKKTSSAESSADDSSATEETASEATESASSDVADSKVESVAAADVKVDDAKANVDVKSADKAVSDNKEASVVKEETKPAAAKVSTGTIYSADGVAKPASMADLLKSLNK